tara:strand:- start:328 stop:699 length:372 start_codon:yes stop_codon:yes gene_type:complete
MMQSNLDNFGSIASIACVLHCLTVSFAPALLSNVQFLSNYNETLEWVFFGFALSFAIFSAGFGFKLHKNPMLMSGFALGIFMLVLGRSAEALSLFEGGGILSILGGAVLFGSHFYSMRCCREA